MMNKLLLEGKILIASPKLVGSFFEKSLIYIFAHNSGGALGIVLNHIIGSVSNHELLKLLNENTNKVKSQNLPIVLGGPVNTEKIIALSVDKEQDKQLNSMASIAVYTNIQSFLKDYVIKNKKCKFLLARGVSAWEASQLEKEIVENSWFIIQAKSDLIFSQEVKDKWSLAIEEIGIKDSLYIAPYTGNS